MVLILYIILVGVFASGFYLGTIVKNKIMEKLNIAELLKYCPKGMPLDSTMWDNLYFDRVENDLIHCYYELDGYRNTTMFCKNGCYTAHKLSKCVIFPKGKTSWEGFVPPCQFKDGDVLSYQNPDFKNPSIYIYSDKDNLNTSYYVALSDGDFKIRAKDCMYCALYGNHKSVRFATEEEKQKLFDAIKANGYKWNAETKTLEKLVEPKFKAGDKIRNIKTGREFVIKSISANNQYYNLSPYLFTVWVQEQNDYELVSDKFDITTLKPFDKVLVRDDSEQKWTVDLFSFHDRNLVYPYCCVGHYVHQCIPYKGNEHLLGTTNDCDNFYKTWEDNRTKI